MPDLDSPLKTYLDGLVARFERPPFIADDPISIPHGFDDARDREVIGLYAALLAWGRRVTIMNKLAELCERMRFHPYRFVRDFDESDAACLDGFKHRTFTSADACHLTRALSALLREHGTLESAFGHHLSAKAPDIGPAIQGFSESVMTAVPGVPPRLQKHLARPSTGSACKRLAMYLRWMVRPGPVDFGQWTCLSPAQLVLPLDVHTGRQARALGLLTRRHDDWRAVQEVTDRLRSFAPDDPARYDFALFGAGAYGLEHPTEFVATS